MGDPFLNDFALGMPAPGRVAELGDNGRTDRAALSPAG
jgi:hypothetical protein